MMMMLIVIIQQISSVQQVLAQQFSETMMYPLSKFLQADIEGKPYRSLGLLKHIEGKLYRSSGLLKQEFSEIIHHLSHLDDF